MAKIAVELGFPLMAWQQYVADVALEYDPATGKPAYRTVTLTIPRQNGKTQLILSVMIARCLLWGDKQSVVFGAQTGKDVRGKWKKDLLPMIEKSPLKSLVRRAYLSDGDTNVLWRNGSRISMVDNTPTAGHGMTLDLVMLDEAFAHKDDAPETAFGSTIATRPNAQIWNVSTAGTAESTYLIQKVDAGRAAVVGGLTSGTAYFEWGVPEDEDPYDMDVLRNRFPAWGVTIDEEYILWAQNEFPTGVYRRNIGNQWTETEERVIPAEFWKAACSTAVRADPTCYAIDGRPDRSQAVVAKADAGGNVELVAVKAGMDPEAELVAAFGEARRLPVVCDKTGPVSGIGRELESKGFEVVWLDSTSVRQACARFYDHLADQKIHIRTDERLDVAARNAAQKSNADLWGWNRDAVGGELLMAVSLAYSHAVTVDEWQPMVAAL